MKTVRANKGPFSERPHFELQEIEDMCTSELRSTGLYPASPGPIRIERFIEKRFGISPTYDVLPDGVLGFTEFGADGVKEIVISAELEADAGTPAERRLRTTLAHEAGHGLLHAYLFALGTKPASLFGEVSDVPKILCRDIVEDRGAASGYDGRWWEYQANMVIGGLLLPHRLVEQSLMAFTKQVGSFAQLTIPEETKEAAIRELSAVFNVNPAVARIRLTDLMLTKNDRQSYL